MKVLKNNAGNYFVQGRGFTGAQAQATRFDNEAKANETAKCAEAMGLGYSYTEEVAGGDPLIIQNADGSSFAVSFIRPKDVVGGQVRANKLNPSKRRFRLEAEANQHGNRFKRLENHLGFYVTKVYEPVNAYVNVLNGKTNPEIGRARTNRA